jgi:hypothetical protein
VYDKGGSLERKKGFSVKSSSSKHNEIIGSFKLKSLERRGIMFGVDPEIALIENIKSIGADPNFLRPQASPYRKRR